MENAVIFFLISEELVVLVRAILQGKSKDYYD